VPISRSIAIVVSSGKPITFEVEVAEPAREEQWNEKCR
jgi:hypothetical protein